MNETVIVVVWKLFTNFLSSSQSELRMNIVGRLSTIRDLVCMSNLIKYMGSRNVVLPWKNLLALIFFFCTTKRNVVSVTRA